MSEGIDSVLARARRERPAPLPVHFADRVLHHAARQAGRMPLVATRAGILTTATTAVLAAAAITWEMSRSASSEPPPLGAFSPTLLIP